MIENGFYHLLPQDQMQIALYHQYFPRLVILEIQL